jgi:hypothetical protein
LKMAQVHFPGHLLHLGKEFLSDNGCAV